MARSSVVSINAIQAGLQFRMVRMPTQSSNDHIADLPTPVQGDPYYRTDPATAVLAWYDRAERLWTVYLINDRGEQQGHAEYGWSPADAADEAARLYRQALSNHPH